jgi:hypothetical protein
MTVTVPHDKIKRYQTGAQRSEASLCDWSCFPARKYLKLVRNFCSTTNPVESQWFFSAGTHPAVGHELYLVIYSTLFQPGFNRRGGDL